MNFNPTVSVIVLCYNQETTISRTIESILNQKSSYSFEIIIGEDNSPDDNTRELCGLYVNKFPDIIKILPRSENKGLMQNYYDCISLSAGKYIAVCAGDDWWHDSNKLQLQIDFMEKNFDYGLTFTNYRIFKYDMINKLNNFSIPKIISFDEDKYYIELLKGNFICAASVIFRNDLFKKWINFEEYIELDFKMEDYPMWLEMINHTKFKYFPTETVTYTKADGSISNNSNNFHKIESFESSVLNIKNYFLAKYPISNELNRIVIRSHYKSLVAILIKNGHYKRAKFYSKYLLKNDLKGILIFMICNSPLSILYNKYINYKDKLNGK